LNEEKKQQVIALGRLGWSLRRIERRTGVRRETAATYLKAAGVPLRPPGGWGRHDPKPAIEVTTDSGAELTTDGAAEDDPKPGRSPSASACEPYPEVIAAGLSRGRNAMAIWQDLVDTCGFAAGIMIGSEPYRPAAARNPISPFPFPLRGKPGRAGAPHAAQSAAPPARGISNRSAEIPLARSPCRVAADLPGNYLLSSVKMR
jgi:hypothetical protein